MWARLYVFVRHPFQILNQNIDFYETWHERYNHLTDFHENCYQCYTVGRHSNATRSNWLLSVATSRRIREFVKKEQNSAFPF